MIPTIDIVVMRIHEGQLEFLQIRRNKAPAEGIYTIPGGFVFEDEDSNLGDSLIRIIKQKVGVDIRYVEQVETVGSRDRDSRGWSMSVVHLAFLADSNLPNNDYMRWCRMDDAAAIDALPFDHAVLVKKALQRLRAKAHYSSLPMFLFDTLFTLSELQRAYEVILGQPQNKSAFRNRFARVNGLIETNEQKIMGKRPAQLYGVAQDAQVEFFDRMMFGTES